MKRQRNEIVELSSDDSSDDFVATHKLKSKRVSIVLKKRTGPKSSKKRSLSKSPQKTKSLYGRGKRRIKPNRKFSNEDLDDSLLISSSKRAAVRCVKPVIQIEKSSETEECQETSTAAAAAALDDVLAARLQPMDTSDEGSSIGYTLLYTSPTEDSKRDKENISTQSLPSSSKNSADSTELSAAKISKNENTVTTNSNLTNEQSQHVKKSPEIGDKEPTNRPSTDKNSLDSHPASKTEDPIQNTPLSISPPLSPSKSAHNTSPRTSLDSAEKIVSLIDDKNVKSPTGKTSYSTVNKNEDTLGYSFCQICQKNITGYSTERRRSHVNKCCDELERLNNFGNRSSLTSRGKRPTPTRLYCPLCPKSYGNRGALKSHLRACCREHNKDLGTVVEMCLASTSKEGERSRADKSVKSKVKKPQAPTALVLEKDRAVNRAQNKILDLVADMTNEEIPSTPALKTSNLTTYRSKHNSIWNIAGSSNTPETSSVLKQDNSTINTQKNEDEVLGTQTVAQGSIILERSALPSQADFTQLTQFLTDLGKDDSMKERLTTLMSPSKIKVETASQGSSVSFSCKDTSASVPDKPVIQITNNYRKNRSVADKQLNEVTTAPVIKEDMPPPSKLTSETANTDDEEMECSSAKEDLVQPDKSPNPSEISALGNSSHIRTPARDPSEMVSSIHDATSSIPDPTSDVQDPEDSNMDLFAATAHAVTVIRREEKFDRSPDRALLNVSPITDSGLTEEDRDPPPLSSTLISKETPSPIYRAKLCSSTTRDCDVITAPIATCHKMVQAVRETHNAAAETVLTTRVTATNTDISTTRSVACDTDTLDKVSVKTQADGEARLGGMMRRLLSDTSSTDVTLLCSDGTERRAHRLILNAACPALLNYPTPDKCKCTQNTCTCGAIELQIGSVAADLFLEFVYTQRIRIVRIENEVLAELNSIAERLDMMELKIHLHSKQPHTIHIDLEQESGSRIQLSLSTQDMLNLSQKIEMASSQCLEDSMLHDTASFLDISSPREVGKLSSDIVDCTPGDRDNRTDTTTDRHDISFPDRNDLLSRGDISVPDELPSFQEHEIFPVSSSPDGIFASGQLDLSQQPEDESETSPRRPTSVVIDVTNENSSDFEDLPASGILIGGREHSSPGIHSEDTKGEENTNMSEEDKRVSQLAQDVEFIDLVKNLDAPVVNSPLSFLDMDSPNPIIIEPATSKTPNLLPNKELFSLGLTPTRESASSTPKNRRDTLATPTQADMSVYQKTPNYKDMGTPVIKDKIGKFGLKPLSKKKAVAKLEEIHRFTNKKFLKCPIEDEKDYDPEDKDSEGIENTECPVGDITITERVAKSATTEVTQQVMSAIKGNESLHCQVLTYQPIDIIYIKSMIKRRTSVGLIAQVLDELGITYFNSETKGRHGRKGSKRPKR